MASHLEAQRYFAIFSALSAANPAPETELNYSNPYQLLVAVVLSAQATDKSVNQATHQLFVEVQHPNDLLALGEQRLLEQIQSIGLFRTKARNLIKMAEQLLAEHDGQVPANREALMALAGVGRKSANVVLNICFHQPTIAVDTHVLRVSNRLRLANSDNPIAVERQLESVVPEPFLLTAHHLLILHGRYTCKARKPACATCVLQELCPEAALRLSHAPAER